MAKSELLRQRLEVFINKYYKNLLIKGAIYAVGLSATYFFVLALAEYFGRFGSTTRLVLLVSLIAGLLLILGYYILYPLSRLLKIGKRISYEKAATLIGKHFPDVDDKLLNAIQLQSISQAQSALIQASIDQRIEKLTPVPFTRAVDFKENKKYWPILVIPVLIFVGVGLSGEWGSFTESGRRIAEFNKEFVPVAPFEFVLLNEESKVEEGQPLSIELELRGDKIPSEALLVMNGEEMRMSKSGDLFKFTFPSVSTHLSVRFKSQGFYSKTYEFEVLEVPQLQDVSVQIIPPAYTGLKASTNELKTVHDVPEGSRVLWTINGKKVEKAWLLRDTVRVDFDKKSEDQFSLVMNLKKDMEYAIDVSSDEVKKRGVSGSKIHVIKDQYPSIYVEFERDSLEPNVMYYTGAASDDYGIREVQLILERGERNEVLKTLKSSGIRKQLGDLIVLDSLVGEESASVKLFLKVWDNDGVNGSKFTLSKPFMLELKGKNERKEEVEKGYQEYFQRKEQQADQQEELKKAMEEMKRSLMENKSLNFKEKSKLKELLKKQEELLKKQAEDEELLEKLKREEEKLGLKKEELKEEEKNLDELKPEDQEIQDLMKEIEELMEKLDTEKLQKKLDELDRKNQSNQRMEERKEDLLKDLKFKKDLLESAERLENLSKEMQDLADKTGNEQEESAKQKEIEKEFEKVAEKLEEMKKENSSFDEQAEKEKMGEQQQEAESEMGKSQDKLQKKNSEGANENQKKAGEKMQEMSQSLQNSMMGMQSQSNKENIETLRQILENLETVSFDIEELSDKSKVIKRDDPGIKKILTEQQRLMLGTKIIEDSLMALASRAPQIEQFVFDELDDMKYNLEKGVENVQELEMGKAASNQQYVMTAANNLALMLEQSLRNMQKMQAQMMQGQQQCQKPGSKPDGQTLKEMQSQMGKMMDRLKEGQQKGEMGKMSKEIVETISKQEQLREALEEMQSKDGGKGSKGNEQKAIEELKKLQEDLMNGRIGDNYKERLKEIETRLLESEKAELKQKQDEKRESKTSDELKQIYANELEKYLKEKGLEDEVLEQLPVELRNYYKGQTNQYLGVK